MRVCGPVVFESTSYCAKVALEATTAVPNWKACPAARRREASSAWIECARFTHTTSPAAKSSSGVNTTFWPPFRNEKCPRAGPLWRPKTRKLSLSTEFCATGRSKTTVIAVVTGATEIAAGMVWTTARVPPGPTGRARWAATSDVRLESRTRQENDCRNMGTSGGEGGGARIAPGPHVLIPCVRLGCRGLRLRQSFSACPQPKRTAEARRTRSLAEERRGLRIVDSRRAEAPEVPCPSILPPRSSASSAAPRCVLLPGESRHAKTSGRSCSADLAPDRFVLDVLVGRQQKGLAQDDRERAVALERQVHRVERAARV